MCPGSAVNRIVRVAAVPAAIALLSFCPVAGQIPDGPYFGQDPPGMTPEIFAPDIVSFDDRREDKICFSPDGQQCAVGVRFEIEYTRQEGGHWLPWDNTIFGSHAREPFFSPDGTRFFHVWNWEIYMSEYGLGQWSTPVTLPSPVNLPIMFVGQWVPLTTLDGTLYFASNRDGTGGTQPFDLAIYRAPLVDGAYPEVEKLGPEINGPHGAADPFVAPDESYMIFGMHRPDGYGDMDFYITYPSADGAWTEPKNLGPTVNTAGIEFAPYVSYDGNYFFFSRPEGFVTEDDPSDILWVDSAVLFQTQACCSPDNSCEDLVDPRTCADSSGTPAGNGMVCLGDGNGDGFDDVCVLPCVADPPQDEEQPGAVEKNRYISFVPANAGTPTALRVTLADLPGEYAIWNERTMWVTDPRDVTEQSGSNAETPAPTFKVATLSCQQDCRDWGALGLIDVFGEAVIPGAQYHVQAIRCSCDPLDEANYSVALPVATSRYGDIVGQFDSAVCSWTPPNGTVSIPFDTVADLDKFQNLPCSPRKARTDLVGVPPNRACVDQEVHVSDFVDTVDAFRGLPYPFSPTDPDPCNAVSCPDP